MTTTIFPREEHTQALFREILKDPAACERLMDTFCRSLNSDEDINESVSAKEFAEALFQACLLYTSYAQADLELYEFFKSQGAAIVNDAADFAGTNGCYLYQGRDVKEDKDR